MKHVALKLLLTAAMLYPAMIFAGDLARDALFHIARNTNANIIQYDARVTASGMLDPKEPVVGYWIRLAEQGQVKDLTRIQKKLAYGFKTKLNKDDNTAIMDMAANIGRTIQVRRDAEDYHAIANIDGVESYIDKIYIHATGKGISTKVDYIELYGKAVNNGNDQYERFSP